MKLEFVEMWGFRGFRDKVCIEFGAGFTVVSGRNGVGKSTICDAVEFVLTGSIDKYRVEKSGSETLTDYVWWRGKGRPENHYVKLAFVGVEGTKVTVIRSREAGCDHSARELEDILCSVPCPENALGLLCRTTIIRDEWISALSVDMTETERFKLVRSALGTAEGTDLADKARAVVSRADSMARGRQEEYALLRRRLEDAMCEISAVEVAVARTGDLGDARSIVAAAIEDAPTEMLDQLRLAREAIVRGRERARMIGEAIERGAGLAERRAFVGSKEFKEGYDAARQELEAANERRVARDRAFEQAHRVMAAKEDEDQVAASLLQLVEHGERVGLHDSRCPVCASEVTLDEFQEGLAGARRRANELAAGATLAFEALHDAQVEAGAAGELWSKARDRLAVYEQRNQEHIDEEGAYGVLLQALEVDSAFAEDLDRLRRQAEEERDRLIDLERAVASLEASQFVARIVRTEDRMSLLRTAADEAARELRRWEAALEDAKAMERVVKRVNAEIIEERLAQISPLLKELYQRLRPHTDWRTIDYRIRGDVRRFLSLKVGDGLNPQFVLSSGQRRAVGLAFLLSIHIARRWAKWRTLLLDDPVQHIDDFRSLHFVEILSAMRLDDRQVVCTVEDEALADLLCRRLSNNAEERGRRYEVGVDTGGETVVLRDEYVAPLATRVLRQTA